MCHTCLKLKTQKLYPYVRRASDRVTTSKRLNHALSNNLHKWVMYEGIKNEYVDGLCPLITKYTHTKH